MEWLQDMQRALRRDDDATREIACKLGTWKVVETKLVPLLLECRDDLELVVTLTKIFVMLTMPLSPYVKKWAQAHANPKPDPELGGGSEGIKRRLAAKNQVNHLLAMKRALAKEEVVAVLVATLEEPLSRGAARTEEDKLVVELVLTLLRNMLCIEDLCKGVGAAGGAEEEMADALLHAELLCIFDREYVFDVILFLCQGIQAPENAPWNLLLMEILFHLYKDQDPADVAMAGPRPAAEEEEEGGGGEQQQQPQEGEENAPGVGNEAVAASPPPAARKKKNDGLSTILQQESMSRAAVVQQTRSRHSRFGGGLLVTGLDGRAARLVTNPFKDALSSLPQARRKRTRRGAAPMSGAGKGMGGGVLDMSSFQRAADPLTIRAHQGLHSLTKGLIEDAYESFMKSLKNEFRRDSSRLEAGDRVVFFRIVRFCLAFHRVLCRVEKEAGATPPDWVGSLVRLFVWWGGGWVGG